MRDRIDPKAEKAFGDKVTEALGLLLLMKPLLKRAGSLTTAEQNVLHDTSSQASRLIHESHDIYYTALKAEDTAAAVRIAK